LKTGFPVLNFPSYELRIRRQEEGAYSIFDRCRKIFVDLTPEEWVRQHLLHFLVEEKKFPESLIVVEKSLKLNNTQKRADVIVYDNSLKPLLIAECKEPGVQLSQQVLDQALRYNLVFNVSYLVLSNGISHYVCKLGPAGSVLLSDIPDYKDL
jgi:hypothetical protein